MDGHSIVALFEGGAMRSIIVAAEASTASFLQRHKAFDKFAGTSNGGLIAMCVAAEQADDMITVFLNDVPSPKFINFKRMLRGNIADVHYFVDGILMGDPGLQWEKVRDSAIPVDLIARSAVTGEPVVFNDFNSSEAVFGSLKAAMWMPRIAGWKPHIHNECPYWDHMGNGLEVVAAEDHSHIVVFRSSDKKLKLSRSVLKSDVSIEEIRPPKTIGRFEKRQKVLKNAAKIGALTALEAFDATNSEVEIVAERFERFGVAI